MFPVLHPLRSDLTIRSNPTILARSILTSLILLKDLCLRIHLIRFGPTTLTILSNRKLQFVQTIQNSLKFHLFLRVQKVHSILTILKNRSCRSHQTIRTIRSDRFDLRTLNSLIVRSSLRILSIRTIH